MITIYYYNKKDILECLHKNGYKYIASDPIREIRVHRKKVKDGNDICLPYNLTLTTTLEKYLEQIETDLEKIQLKK